MRTVALASIASLAATLALPAQVLASGWIVVDPIMGGRPALVPRPVVRPHPGATPTVPAPGRRPILQASVSFGLHLKDEDIKVDIVDQVAKTYITQTFSNDTDSNLAGTYLFPLPDDTTFSSFSLHIDGKPVEGKILEANAARTEYEQIVRSMVDPGLLEFADYKTVRARIFPIPAHGTKKVELEYTQVLKAENGMLKYRFPLKAEGEAEPVESIKMNVKLAGKQPLRTIWSPTHTVTSTRKGDTEANVSLAANNTVPDKDFLLYYSISDKDVAANLLTHRKSEEDGYFLMTLSPPVTSTGPTAKDIVVVADTSGSMQGEKMEQNQKALKYIVDALSPEDRFSLIQFNTDADAFSPKLLAASPENKKAAEKFISELEARGGTNISDALSLGTTILNEASDRPAYLVLITDGEPTVGETVVDKLLQGVKSKRDIRIFDFGVGYDVNTRLLNKLAEEHHGTAQYVEPSESLEVALSNFYQKIKSPVLSDVKITYDGIQVKDVYPKEVKDIFAGQQVLLIGRYKGEGKASLKLSGRINSENKDFAFPVEFAKEDTGHSYLPRIWAMRRIGYLTEVAHANDESKEVVDEIIALSQKYGIISAYTSYLVTDPSESHGSALRRNMPGAVSFSRGGAGAGGGFDDRFHRIERGVRGGLVPPPPAMTLSSLPASHRGRASRMPATSLDTFVAHSAERDVSVFGDEGSYAQPPVGTKGMDRSMVMGRMMARKARADAFATYEPKEESGQKAVLVAKTLNELKESNAINKQDLLAGEMKTIEDKTFYLVDGFWTESTFKKADKTIKEIEFKSEEYFALMKSVPGITKYLSVGRQVIVEFNGTWYKIVQTGDATG
ncbi:MAG: VWA domain-containing protein [Candidatus Melainabacteria bacterium]|nr:VWA domain-containing protein [Candidatus Melainabacteria bacterium]